MTTTGEATEIKQIKQTVDQSHAPETLEKRSLRDKAR